MELMEICCHGYKIFYQNVHSQGLPGKNGTYWKLIQGRLVVIFMQSSFRDA